MCGRFALMTDPATIAGIFQLDAIPAPLASPRYNIAPGQSILAIRQPSACRVAASLRWGLIPFWATDPSIANRLINARADTLAAKPAFRSAYQSRRCLIPADGFYEWQRHGPQRQPFFFQAPDHQLLALAALWERWLDPAGQNLETCTIITTSANAIVSPLHDRMPVILPPASWNLWLTPDTPLSALDPLLIPAPANALQARPVSRLVNRFGQDSPACLDPAPAPKPPAAATPTLFDLGPP